MQFYIFRSKNDVSAVAFTEGPTGGNLPLELAPWSGQGSIDFPPRLAALLIPDIQTEGFAILLRYRPGFH
jgi:hypothetical protein